MRHFVSALVIMALALGSILAASKHQPISDDRLIDQVRMKLASDSEVGASHIDVDVKNGVVTLKGRVENEKKRQKAGKVAKKVKGVTSVQNEITVGPPK